MRIQVSTIWTHRCLFLLIIKNEKKDEGFRKERQNETLKIKRVEKKNSNEAMSLQAPFAPQNSIDNLIRLRAITHTHAYALHGTMVQKYFLD